MHLASVRIFVTDLPAAAKFYAEVVGLEQVWSSPDAVVFGRQPMMVIEAADAEAHAEGLVARFTGVAVRHRRCRRPLRRARHARACQRTALPSASPGAAFSCTPTIPPATPSPSCSAAQGSDP